MRAGTSFRELLVLPENLIWSWRKAKALYQASDALHDQSQVAAFELNLDQELRRIRRDFESGNFRPQPIRLLPQPKRPDAAGKPRMRQSFQISVRDQVAWIALINVVGPSLDQLMPAWSYGHRLYRSAWYDDDALGVSRLNIGPYRHTNSNLYRKFKHSWPLFRRHISLTARKMATGKIDRNDLDHGDRQALEHAIEFSRVTDRLSYLEDGYWSQSQDAKEHYKIYYASFDLEKFYPQLTPTCILNALDQTLSGFAEDLGFRGLVAQMLQFDVNVRGLSEALLASVDPPTHSGQLNGLPTGLMVAGFLANVALLPVDKEVEEQIHRNRNFAQFRFVDDHSILAFNFDTILEQIQNYGRLLEKFDVGPKIAEDKYDPVELKDLVQFGNEKPSYNASQYKKAKSDCEIDGRRPNKLLTRTLAQVSILAAADFDTLTDDSKLQRLEQLEWLLLANIPEREVRADTRAAFAAGRIAALAPTLYSTNLDLVEALRARTNANVSPSSASPSVEDLQIKIQMHDEEARWKDHCGYYFSLLFQAFVEHPDKVRLLIRLLDYGRSTGFDVLKRLAEWMDENSTGPNFLLKRYLSALTLHVLSKHLIRAACDQAKISLLHRQSKGAKEFIDTVILLRTESFTDAKGILSQQPEFFQIDALSAFCVGLRSAAAILQSLHDSRSAQLDAMAGSIFSSKWQSDSGDWHRTTGSGIGVWVHWAQSLMGAQIDEPTAIWLAAAESHDPSQRSDWNSLRRFCVYANGRIHRFVEVVRSREYRTRWRKFRCRKFHRESRNAWPAGPIRQGQ